MLQGVETKYFRKTYETYEIICIFAEPNNYYRDMRYLYLFLFVCIVVCLFVGPDPVGPYVVEGCYYNARRNNYVSVVVDVLGNSHTVSTDSVMCVGDIIE